MNSYTSSISQSQFHGTLHLTDLYSLNPCNNHKNHLNNHICEAGAMCKFKDLLISNMTKSSIQMDLVSEVRTPQQALNFATNRKRRQANQQETLKAHTSKINWSQVLYSRSRPRPPTPQRPPKPPIWPNIHQENLNHAINVTKHSLKIFLTCAKLEISRAKSARRSDISLHYAKHQCPKVEKPSH